MSISIHLYLYCHGACIPPDVVYVGVVNTKHLEVASLLLRGGKHVLCEKPLSMNLRQTRELLEAARQNGRFLMEVRGAVVTAGHTHTTSN